MNCFSDTIMRYFVFGLFFFLFFFSCTQKNQEKVDLSGITAPITIKRFDQEFYNATPKNLTSIRNKYPYLFPGNEADSVWLRRKNDSLSQVLYKASQKAFGDFKEQGKDIEKLCKYVTYYYPNFTPPKVVTLISNLDLDHQIIYADSLLLISLDTYLGSNSIFYANYPDYLKRNYDKRVLPVHIASAIAKEVLPKIPYRTFIDRIINEGKRVYAMHQFIPDVSDKDLFIYTSEQYKWLSENEENIWKYFIEKEYLYSTDKELKARFLDPAPFSKFYLVTDTKSPGQVGSWIGYQIVESYMQYNDVSLPQLMATAPTQIFKKSKYKPKR